MKLTARRREKLVRSIVREVLVEASRSLGKKRRRPTSGKRTVPRPAARETRLRPAVAFVPAAPPPAPVCWICEKPGADTETSPGRFAHLEPCFNAWDTHDEMMTALLGRIDADRYPDSADDPPAANEPMQQDTPQDAPLKAA